MKICVLNGSPRGDYSTTLHNIYYLEKVFKEHTFKYFNIAQRIKGLEKNPYDVINLINESDLIIFAYPVYTFLAPSQVHRFFEILKITNTNFKNKFVTQLTTSKHFYDVTAHNYVKENLFDLDAKYIEGLSLDMDDLLKDQGKKDLESFFRFVEWSVKNDNYEIPKKIVYKKVPRYQASLPEIQNKDESKEIVIVTDLKEDDVNLSNMIKDFQNNLKYKSKVVNLRQFKFINGCVGCLHCTYTGDCVFQRDGFQELLRNEILTASAIIYAFTIKDHSMGYRFKMYDDRQFCNGHRLTTEGIPVGYIVNGDYASEHNLQTIIEARAETGKNYLSGVATNKEEILNMSSKLIYAIENNYEKPRNFYGVGGIKIFRDLVWVMRGVMREDHKFYKKHGFYDDLPSHNKSKMLLMCFLGSMMKLKSVRAKLGKRFDLEMVKPYKKEIEKLEKKK